MGSLYRTSSQQLKPESISIFTEGISLILSRWTALQLAIQNEWGGKDTRWKSEQFASDLFSWFSQSNVPKRIDDLENMLDENMVLTFNTDIEDGSIEEVAEQLMIIHEDCLQEHYESVEKLRKSNKITEARSQSRQCEEMNKKDERRLDCVNLVKAADDPHKRSGLVLKETSRDEQKSRETVRPEDKCSLVPTTRNRGLRTLIEGK